MPEPRLIDGREMEPPEPLERALAELATLTADEELVMLLNCEPLPLYAILDRRGYCYRTCLLYTSPSPRDRTRSRMPSSA